MSVVQIAEAVRSRQVTAVDVTQACLARLGSGDRLITAITRTLAERALHEAGQVDALIAAGRDPGPLAGVPYGVKDLFDIEGIPTTAGSALYADAAPAKEDAEAIKRLKRAGAVLVATLNMDEFAYGFATVNARHGTTRNPHDPDRLAGGSSGGSAAAVAAGLLAFSLGSDTNGSIRVPASLCGLYGLKPTHGDLPLAGAFPFAESFDDVGPFARTSADMRRLWRVLGGRGPWVVESKRSVPRIALLGSRFHNNADPDQISAMLDIAPDAPVVVIPDIARARSAAFLITAYEGGRLHREALCHNAMQFDPAVRDRLIAGTLFPQPIYEEAQAFRIAFRQEVLHLVADYDVLLAPAAPCVAPLVADPRICIDGELRSARTDLGIHTQPISFLGFPSLAVPLRREGKLPIGLQLIGKPGTESMLMDFAETLENEGLISAPDTPGMHLDVVKV